MQHTYAYPVESTNKAYENVLGVGWGGGAPPPCCLKEAQCRSFSVLYHILEINSRAFPPAQRNNPGEYMVDATRGYDHTAPCTKFAQASDMHDVQKVHVPCNNKVRGPL